jgi:hypothetical protein
MAKKKVSQQRKAAPQRQSPKRNPRFLLILGATVVLLVVGTWAATNLDGKSATTSASAAPAEEQKYLGRLLPANYQEPMVADVQVYATTVKMTNATAAQTDAEISIPADQVVASKIVSFEYQKPGAEAIPMLAYIKPSGKLFVGVSYCPPCQGTGQRIEAGATLVCESCGTVRNLETGVGVRGACKLYPLDELPASLSNGKITVSTSAINSWSPQPIDRPTNS